MLDADGAGDDGVFDGAVLHLFSNNLTPNPLTAVGDFTTATFTGAATPTLAAPVGPVLTSGGDAIVYWPAVEQRPSDNVTPNTIYGYYVLTSGGALIFSKRFDAAVNMTDADHAIAFIPQFTLPLFTP